MPTETNRIHVTAFQQTVTFSRSGRTAPFGLLLLTEGTSHHKLLICYN